MGRGAGTRGRSWRIQMSLRWYAASHLPCTCPPGLWARDTGPTLLFQLPVSALTCLFSPDVPSRPMSGHPGLPLQPSVNQPIPMSNPPTSSLPPDQWFLQPASPTALLWTRTPQPAPALTPKPPAAAAGQSPQPAFPSAASRAPRTNPIRKSSCLLRAMNRPRRGRRTRRLRGLRSRTRTSSSPQLATHRHRAGQPSQAMLGGGARRRGAGGGGGAGRC